MARPAVDSLQRYIYYVTENASKLKENVSTNVLAVSSGTNSPTEVKSPGGGEGELYLSTPRRQRLSWSAAKDTGWPLSARSEISNSMSRSISLSGESSSSYLPFMRNSIFIGN